MRTSTPARHAVLPATARILALLLALGLAAAPARSAPVAPATPPPAEWSAGAKQQIAELEYRFASQTDGSFAAPNRAHNLRVAIGDQGATLTSRTRGENAFRIALRLTELGRGERFSKVPAAPPRLEGERIVIEREALGVSEWFANDRSGVEQGFELRAAPARAAAGAPVVLRLAVEGAGDIGVPADGQSAAFVAEDGSTAFLYTKLLVTDARGTRLPAVMARSADGLELRVDDTEATYPVTVDPLATSPSATLNGTQGDGQLGYSVATAGDVNGDGYSDVIVGAWQYDQSFVNEGAAFLYMGGASGLSQTPSPWLGRGAQVGACYGVAVSTAGDLNNDGYDDVVIGAFLYDISFSNEGAAFAYLGTSSGLSALPTWIKGGGANNEYFGDAVSTAGDVNSDGFADLLVGAPNHTNPTDREGAAYLFTGGTSPVLSSTPTWSFESNSLATVFGYSVAAAGDVNGDGYDDVIIGSPGVPTIAGRAYVFHGSGTFPYLPSSPSWTQTDGTASARFGHTVAGAGDLNGDGYADVVVGEPNYDGGQAFEGRILVYAGGGGGLSTSPTTLESNEASTYYGTSVATAGDVNGDGYADLMVGKGSNTVGIGGFAFVYPGSIGGFIATPLWTAQSSQQGDIFGFSVATAGDVNGDGYSDVLVGAPYHNGASTIKSGAAYCYLGGPEGPSTDLAWATEGVNQEDVVGWSVAPAGDLNADGFGDVLVGAPLYDFNVADGGAVFAFYGSVNGLPNAPSWARYGDQAGENLGISVSSAGDITNDGYGDIIVGAHVYNNVGAAFSWSGGQFGLPNAPPSWTALGVSAVGYFGGSVAWAGDVNGDGFSDVIVGAPHESINGWVENGSARVYLGSGSGLQLVAAWTGSGEFNQAYFGQSVAGAGDVNRDGLSDVIVGAPNHFANGGTRPGRAYVFSGLASSTGVRSNAMWARTSTFDNGQFGCSVASAGDVNGDGYADVVIGASGFNNVGRAEVYYGGADGPAANASWTKDSDQAFSGWGASVAGAGDVNNDGYSDVLVGAVFYDGAGGQDCGRVLLYYGGASGLATTDGWHVDGLQTFSNIGHVISSAGDVNGDGFADILAGQPGYTGFNYRSGVATLYLGNNRYGIPRFVGQWQNCLHCIVKRVSPLGFANSPGYYVSLRSKTAKGRDKVRAQLEVKPLGTNFDRTGLTIGPLNDTSLGAFAENVGAVCSGANPCHWRMRLVGKSPYFPRTPWYSLGHNGPNEADIRMAGPTLAVESPDAPTELALSDGSPNPTHDASRVVFTLPRGGLVRLSVCDISGRRVRSLAQGWRPEGHHELTWDGLDEEGSPVRAGVYFYRLEANGRAASSRVALIP